MPPSHPASEPNPPTIDVRERLRAEAERALDDAQYDQAALSYERFARDYPQDERAEAALSDAIVLRLGLGELEPATENVTLFHKLFGTRRPARSAELSFALGDSLVEHGHWASARSHFINDLHLIDQHGSLDIRIQAHAALARANKELDRQSDAASAYQAVVELWSRPDEAQRAIADLEDDDAKKLRRLGRALTAVGEGMHYLAGQKRDSLLAASPAPHYPTTHTPLASDAETLRMTARQRERELRKRRTEGDRIRNHVNTKVRAWAEQRRAAIISAEAEYQKIRMLRPVPPPRWTVAAAAEIGAMWASFAREFRGTPIPPWLKKDDELRIVYYQSLDAASDPIKQRAKAAFVTCTKLSVTLRVFNDDADRCASWLRANERGEYAWSPGIVAVPGFFDAGASPPQPLLPGTALNLLALQHYVRSGASQHGNMALAGAARTPSSLSTESRQMLAKAELTCTRALQKDPVYGPVHNTLGLIKLAFGDMTAAVRSFEMARRLAPRSFEPNMNFGMSMLTRAGYDDAEQAFRTACELQPDSYEAHLGLAASLGGQSSRSANPEPLAREARRELERCKQLDVDRPDAYFNEALLVSQPALASNGNAPDAVAALLEAGTLLDEFMAKARGRIEYQSMIKEAKERRGDLALVLAFWRAQPRPGP